MPLYALILYTGTTLPIRSSARKSPFSISFFGRLKAVTVVMQVSLPHLSYYTSSYIHIGPYHNVPWVSNLRLLAAAAWVQSQSIQCGSFVLGGDSGSLFIPSTSSPCASHNSTSDPSAVVLIIRNDYSRSFLLRNSSAYGQPCFSVNTLETSLCDGKK